MCSGIEGDMFDLVGSVLGASSSSSIDVRDCAAVWRHALISKTLDAAQRLAVFSTSHAAFSHVLQSAPHATISLQLYGADPAATVRELILAAKALAMRGQSPPTEVVLEQADDRHATLDLVHAHLFQPAGAHLTHLSLQLHRDTSSQTASDFLTAASTALPNLRQLHLGRLTTPLPPGLFPHTTELRMGWGLRCNDPDAAPALYSSIALYLPHMATLGVAADYIQITQIAWSEIFTATSTSHTLCHLHTNSPLDDALLSLLLQHAPALQSLTVNYLHIKDDHSQAAWGVQQLTLGVPELRASTLLLLPTNHSGQRLRVACPDNIQGARVVIQLSEQGVPQDILDGLCSRFDITNVCCVLSPPASVPAADRTAALIAALHQLASTQLSQQPLAVEVSLNNLVQWPPELLQAVSAAAAALPQLHVTLSFGTLDDALLDALLHHAPAVWGVKAYELKLQYTQHGSDNIQRPWSSLVINNIKHVRELACLPTPRARSWLVEGPTDISWAFTPEQVSCGLADEIIARVHCFGVALAPEPVITINNERLASAAEQPAVLRASLQLLRDMRLVNSQGGTASNVKSVRLDGWTLTPAVIAELAGLPQWCGELRFDDGIKWPRRTEAEAYQQLGRVVPVTYTSWSVARCKWAVEQLVEVCRGMAEVRVGLKPLTLIVSRRGGMMAAIGRGCLLSDDQRKQLGAALAQQHLEEVVHVL